MSYIGVSILLALFLLMASCSSSPAVNSEGGTEKNSVLEPADSPAPVVSTPASPSYEKLLTVLLELGYEGIGLEHEDELTWNFMLSVFSSPKAKNKKIKYVYSGLQLSYDPEQQSLTFGEENNLTKTLAFIEKKIPKR